MIHLSKILIKHSLDASTQVQIFLIRWVLFYFLMQNISTLLQVKTAEDEDELLFFRVAEGIFVGWFTIEYLVRFLVAPQKVLDNS